LVFNEILAARINNGYWGKALTGDILDAQRMPTGALWGRGRVETTAEAADLENAIAQQHTALCEGMEHAGLTQERRAIAAIPRDMQWHWLDNTQLQLKFSLEAGYYATSVLREIIDTREPERIAESLA